MPEKFLTVLAALTLLASALPIDSAAALTVAAPQPRLGLRATLVQPVVSVCGPRGCVPVQTKRVIHHQKPGNTVPHRS